jgi:hypothetical protein
MKWLLILIFIIPIIPAQATMAFDKNKYCPLSQERVLLTIWDRTYYGQWVKTQYWICQ